MKIVKTRLKRKYEEGEQRKRKAFLFLPMTIIQKELKITRWFEFAEWLERWNYSYLATAMGPDAPEYSLRRGQWTATKWTDIEESAFQAIRDLGQEPQIGFDPLNQK